MPIEVSGVQIANDEQLRQMFLSGQIDRELFEGLLRRFYISEGLSETEATEAANRVVRVTIERPDDPAPVALPTPITGETDQDVAGAIEGGTLQGDPTGEAATALGLGPSGLTNEQFQVQQGLTREGRGTLFDQFLAGSGFISPQVRPAASRRFSPLSSQFALTEALKQSLGGGTENLGNFQTFLGTQPDILNRGGFQGLLGALSAGLREGATEEQEAALDPFREDQGAATNAIFNTFAGDNPFLRRFGRGTINRRISQFQGDRPQANIFEAFLRNELFPSFGPQF